LRHTFIATPLLLLYESSSNIQKSRSFSSSDTDQTKVKESSIEKAHISTNPKLTETLNDLLKFPLMDAVAGRRSRRFCMRAEIPDGVLVFKSKHKPMPLSEIEQLLILSTIGGATGWHFAIMRHKGYAPYLSNYCNSPVVVLLLLQQHLQHQRYSIQTIVAYTSFQHVISIRL
jgi:hypothetical protein